MLRKHIFFPLIGGYVNALAPMIRLSASLVFSLALAWLLTGCQKAADATPTPLVPNLQPLEALFGTPEATFPPLPTLDPDTVALGRTVYTENCAVCHGANLEGHPDWKTPNEDGSYRPPPHDASGHTWHHPDSVLIETIRLGGSRLAGNLAGLSNMPAFGEVLSDEEIAAVLTYIKSSWPAEERQYQWEATMRNNQQE
jgi:mono/diheme cytochrome c family protein